MPPPNPPKRRNSWCKVQEIVLGGGLPFAAADPTHSPSPNEISPRGFVPTGKRRGSKGNIIEGNPGLNVVPLDLKPVAPLEVSNVVCDSPSPRASRNQKQMVPELRFGVETPPKFTSPSAPNTISPSPFKHLEYNNKNFLPNKSLGMSVSLEGEIFVKKSIVEAWGGEPNSMEETDRDIQIDKITATRISEEFDRTQSRLDRKSDIYYQYYCKETASKIEGNREKVEEKWVKDGEVKRLNNSNSCFLSAGLDNFEGEGDERTSSKVTEEVERMRKRLLQNVTSNEMAIVSESDFSDGDCAMEIDIPTDSDTEIIKQASARRNKDLNGLINELKVKREGGGVGIGSLLTRSIEAGMMSGGHEIGFSMRSSFEK